MSTDSTQAKNSFKHQLHPDLLAVIATRKPKVEEMRMDSWRPSLFGRVVELFAGRRAR